MGEKFILSSYLKEGMSHAVFDQLQDGTFFGRIPPCKGVIAFESSLKKCEEELRSTFEDWIVVGLKMGHNLPVLSGIDLNKEPTHEPMDAM